MLPCSGRRALAVASKYSNGKRGDAHYTMHNILHNVFWNHITSSGTNIREKGSLSALEIVYSLVLYFQIMDSPLTLNTQKASCNKTTKPLPFYQASTWDHLIASAQEKVILNQYTLPKFR